MISPSPYFPVVGVITDHVKRKFQAQEENTALVFEMTGTYTVISMSEFNCSP
jgi:hypothetical protein